MISMTKTTVVVVTLFALPVAAQITITAADEYTVGEWYDMLTVEDANNPATIPDGTLGVAGEENVWDFTEFSAGEEFQHEFASLSDLEPEQTQHFPNATFAEALTDRAGNLELVVFYDRDEERQQFHGGWFGTRLPEGQVNRCVINNPPLVERRYPYTVGDSWEAQTTFEATVESLLGQVTAVSTQSSSFEIDAWGTVILPELGEIQCLRIHHSQTTIIEIGGIFPLTDTVRSRSYYWASKEYGEVARIIGPQNSELLGDPEAPPLNFGKAISYQFMIGNSRMNNDRNVFRRGDSNDSGDANITDAVAVLNHLFSGAPQPICWEAADVNGDATVNIVDPTFLLNYLFSGGDDLAEPGVSCGADPEAASSLGCEQYTSC